MSKFGVCGLVAVSLALGVSGLAVANGDLSMKPVIEEVKGAFPGEFANKTSLFSDAPVDEVNPVTTFTIEKGEKLRDAMTRWADKAGYELVWQPTPDEGDIIFAANMSFSDSFEGAADSFFEVVRAQTKFDGKVHSNRVLRVFVANSKR